MADQTNGGIAWTDETWNCIRGCRRVNKDCLHCYAEQLAGTRLLESPKYKNLAVMTPSGPRWTGEVSLDADDLLLPLRWKRPRFVFVNSMSDFFYEGLSAEQINQMIAVMALAWWHRFQVLTKRPARMLAHFEAAGFKQDLAASITRAHDVCTRHGLKGPDDRYGLAYQWPLRNVWWGASMGHQAAVNEFMPPLVQTRLHASVLWVSAEPLIEKVSFGARLAQLDWLVVGGESGTNARPCDLEWVRGLVSGCRAARPTVPVFVKQLGAEPFSGAAVHLPESLLIHDLKGGDPSEWPEDLRVREWPFAMLREPHRRRED